MADMKDASCSKANIEMVENYLKNEFESFAGAHRANDSCAHSLTMDNVKKGFALRNGWPIFADRRFNPARIDRLTIENVAKEIHLHGEDGYHWTSSHQDTTRRGDIRKDRLVSPLRMLVKRPDCEQWGQFILGGTGEFGGRGIAGKIA